MKLPTLSSHFYIPETFLFRTMMKRKYHAFIIATVWIAIFGMDFLGADSSQGSAAYISQPTFKSHIM
ncbi:MAG: hypothetical protein NTU74_20890, partial [Deltaproteobacteria bacterium]|nr:hypothetical protein [Deltaproteobacteria bacterium]